MGINCKDCGFPIGDDGDSQCQDCYEIEDNEAEDYVC